MDPASSLRVQPVKYPISTRALDKWARSDLSCYEEDGARHYHYHYVGSTCNDGGSPFHATFHVVVRPSVSGAVVDQAWVELPLGDDNPGATQMCVFQTQPEPFKAELRRPPAFCGRTLEEAISQPIEIDYAGCLCFEQMQNHKWRNVLCTIHYALASEQQAT